MMKKIPLLLMLSIGSLTTANATPNEKMNESTKLEVLAPVIQCYNIKETVKFYTEKMGFELCFKDAEENYGYAVVCRQDIEIHLQQPDPEHIKGADHQLGIRIRVKDIEYLHEEYKKAGILSSELSVKPWGTKEFGLYDPNKVAIHFYEDQ